MCSQALVELFLLNSVGIHMGVGCASIGVQRTRAASLRRGNGGGLFIALPTISPAATEYGPLPGLNKG